MKERFKRVDRHDGSVLYLFHCPGCGYGHSFRTEGGPFQWGWNGDTDKATFTPSLLVFKDDEASRCHSFVTDGRIRFLDDCFHDLKGKTVDVPYWDD